MYKARPDPPAGGILVTGYGDIMPDTMREAFETGVRPVSGIENEIIFVRGAEEGAGFDWHGGYPLRRGYIYALSPDAASEAVFSGVYQIYYLRFITTKALKSGIYSAASGGESAASRTLLSALADINYRYFTEGRSADCLSAYRLTAAGIVEYVLYDAGAPRLSDPRLSAAIGKVCSCPDPTTEQVCAAMGLSPSYAAKYFRARLGHTVAAYVRCYRLITARNLLRAGTPVEEASRNVGYDSCSAFTEAYRGYFGCSPGSQRCGDND